MSMHKFSSIMVGEMELGGWVCMSHEDLDGLSSCDCSFSTVDTSLINDAYENDDFWLPAAKRRKSSSDERDFTFRGDDRPRSNEDVNIEESIETNAHHFSTVQQVNTSIQSANHPLEGQSAWNQPSANLHTGTAVAEHDSTIYNVFDVATGTNSSVQAITKNQHSMHRDVHLSTTNIRIAQPNDASTDLIDQLLRTLLQPNPPSMQHDIHAVSPNEETLSNLQNATSLDYEPVPYHQLVNDESRREGIAQTTTQTGGMTSQSVSMLRPISKPLSAYNFFFRFERQRLLKVYEVMDSGNMANVETFESFSSLLLGSDIPLEFRDHFKWTTDNSVAAQRRILHDQWSRDPCKKRKHSKSEDKRIPFEILTRLIAESWHALPSQVKAVFDEIAYRDKERYKCELAWKERQQ